MELEGKTALVTGANSGIGRATAEKLADRGARVVLLCRDEERCETAKEEMIEETRNEEIFSLLCDLSLMRSVRKGVREFKERYEKLDVLVNNAGTISSSREITEEGNEKIFATNYLGHFLLTNLLIDMIKRGPSGKIINVTSGLHKRGSLDFDDLQGKNSSSFSGWRAYNNSKLALVMFTYILAEKLKGTSVSVISYNPGAVGSNFGSGTIIAKLFYSLFSFLMRSPEEAGEEIVGLIGEHDEETGKYFSKGEEKDSSPESYDVKKQRKLWEESKQLIGLGER